MAQQNLLQAFPVKAWPCPQGGKEEKDICLQWAGTSCCCPHHLPLSEPILTSTFQLLLFL